MTPTILHRRLANQHLLRRARARPEEIVAWFGAMQSQDFAGAKWGVGQRGSGLTDSVVGQAFDEGRVLRTHALRPTWHFVAPADIRWMLELTAPRLHRLNGVMYRRNGLDDTALARSRRALERALAGGLAMTRAELADALKRAGVSAQGEKLAYVMLHAELERIVCSGPRRGKQFTYMLLDARAPSARSLDRDAALGELARRYLQSHGPATLRDFVWWSGLTVRDATAAFDAIAAALERESVDGLGYWSFPEGTRSRMMAGSAAYLFPNYDEFLIAYKDRGLVPAYPAPPAGSVRRDRYAHHLVIDGRLRGSWMRTAGSEDVRIDIETYSPLRRTEREAIDAAADRCGQFMGLRAVVRIQ